MKCLSLRVGALAALAFLIVASASAQMTLGPGGGGTSAPATTSALGIVMCDGITITCAGDGTITSVTGGAGDVVGPASATTDHVVAFNGTTGKLVKGGGIATNALVTTVSTLTSAKIVVGGGTTSVGVIGQATLIAGALTLGTTGTAGSVTMGNATSGTLKIQPVTGALGTVTLSLPAATDTLVGKATTDTLTNKTLTSPTIAGGALSGTFSGDHTYSGVASFTAVGPIIAGANGGNVGSVKLFGNTSGDATIVVPAAAGTATRFQLPATNGSNTNVLQTDGSGNTSWVAATGGSVSVTAATPNIVIDPTPGTGTFTIGTTTPLNTQSGDSGYTILSTDAGKLVNRTNTVTQTDPVPQATGSFASGFGFGYQTGTVGNTLDPTTSTANGLASIKVGAYQAADCTSDGTNWKCALGVPQPAIQTGTTVLRDDMTWAPPPVPPTSAGTSVSLAGPRQNFYCTGTCTVTPPAPVAGYQFCILNDNNVATVITLAAIGSSAMYENTARTAYGTAGTGTAVSGAAAGNAICLLGRDSTHYTTVSFTGTWTMN